MAMNEPYVDENLRLAANMFKQAILNVISGNVFGPNTVPTQAFVARLLGIAPSIWDLYGEELGEGWLQRYLPAPGSTISYPLRQAMQRYEEEMAQRRGTGPTHTPLYSQYKTPAGTPTLQTRLAEAAHAAWQLSNQGLWYNPMENRVELMPKVQRLLSEAGAQYLGSAEGAPLLKGGSTGGAGGGTGGTTAVNWQAVIDALSADNPLRPVLQNISKKGYRPTLSMIERALSWEAEKKQKATPKEEKVEKPTAQEIRNALAGLAAQYDDPAEFQQHLLIHYAELVPVIGEDGFRDLYMNAAQWVGRLGTLQPLGQANMPAAAQVFHNLFNKQRKKEPGQDAIGTFIQEMRSAGLWPLAVGGGGSK